MNRAVALGLGGAGLLIVLLGHALLLHGAFWRGDDPTLLRHALDSPGLRAFHDPAHWQALSPSNLTPWAVQSLRLDALVAGLSPGFFYARQLAALAAVLGAGFVLMRPWLGGAATLAALVVFAVSASTASVIQQLMTRHYLEGLLFALLALLAHQRALGVRPSGARSAGVGTAWSLMAAALYALACTAKEVYVPLVLVAAVWPGLAADGDRRGQEETHPWRRRALALWPWVLVALAYVGWRRAMLPSMVGGYGALSSLLSVDGGLAVAQALAGLPALWLAPAGWGTAGRALAAGLAVIWLAAWVGALARAPQRRRTLGVAAVVGVAVLGPLIPLVSYPGLTAPDRYLFLPAFVATLAGAWALKGWLSPLPRPTMGRRWLRLGAALLAGCTGLAMLAQTVDVQRRTLGPWLASFDAQGRKLLEAPVGDTLVPGRALLQTFWYVNDLCALRSRDGQGTCPQVLVPGWPAARPVDRLLVFDDGTGAWREAGSDRDALLADWTSGDERLPMQVEMTLDGGWIRWAFAAAPGAAGAWFVASPELGRFPVPASGALRMTRPALTVQVQFEPADAGSGARRVVSPVLSVAPGAPVTWQRGAAAP